LASTVAQYEVMVDTSAATGAEGIKRRSDGGTFAGGKGG
jgi:hypothetical protein